jgi:alkanesulfonate monooxygenase SsuD/methylene tetrahydromethanopterin reductase-like flavin-dependent oxidoreductase (luciferase family)
MMKEGTVIAGSPSTVLAEIKRQTDLLGTNYILGYMMFGNLTLEQAMRSLRLFNSEVMPKIKAM